MRRSSFRLGVVLAALALMGLAASPAAAEKKSEPAKAPAAEKNEAPVAAASEEE